MKHGDEYKHEPHHAADWMLFAPSGTTGTLPTSDAVPFPHSLPPSASRTKQTGTSALSSLCSTFVCPLTSVSICLLVMETKHRPSGLWTWGQMFILTHLESHEHLGYNQEVTVCDTSLTRACIKHFNAQIMHTTLKT
jgi:hypothetical protein